MVGRSSSTRLASSDSTSSRSCSAPSNAPRSGASDPTNGPRWTPGSSARPDGTWIRRLWHGAFGTTFSIVWPSRVELPPLHRRQGDVAFLARAFWIALGGDIARLSPDIIQRFEAYSWPGNVRELHNVIARYLAIGDDDLQLPKHGEGRAVTNNDLFERVIKEGKPLPIARQEIMLEFDRLYLTRALASHGGNVGAAAVALGIGRRYFQKLRAKG